MPVNISPPEYSARGRAKIKTRHNFPKDMHNELKLFCFKVWAVCPPTVSDGAARIQCKKAKTEEESHLQSHGNNWRPSWVDQHSFSQWILTLPVVPRDRWFICWVIGPIMLAGCMDIEWSMAGVITAPWWRRWRRWHEWRNRGTTYVCILSSDSYKLLKRGK